MAHNLAPRPDITAIQRLAVIGQQAEIDHPGNEEDKIYRENLELPTVGDEPAQGHEHGEARYDQCKEEARREPDTGRIHNLQVMAYDTHHGCCGGCL